MNKNNNYTDFEKKFFEKNSIGYSKDKKEVWLAMESKLAERKPLKLEKPNFIRKFSYAIAAVFILSISISVFMRFYSETITCPNGKHQIVFLPDGSKVTLNANSSLSYQPYWWRFKRDLHFEGEAFFEVTKGEKFQVLSNQGTTAVLGTKFNVFSRKGEYKVHCISGKVKVSSKSESTVILTKNNYAVLNEKKEIAKFEQAENINHSISWVENEFVFTAVPLSEIFEELERQYDIQIDGKETIKGISSCSFKRTNSPEELINIIGKPFGLVCIKLSEDKYEIRKY